jgi:hypothetical protein
MSYSAYHLGYETYTLDPDGVNPYDFGSDDSEDWACGYESAEREYMRDNFGDDPEWFIDPPFDGDE